MARNTRNISWIKAAQKDFMKFPAAVRESMETALTFAAEGQKADSAKPNNTRGRYRSDQESHQATKGNVEMSEKLEIVKGRGNVFRDLGEKDADVRQTKALLAAEIVRILDKEKLSVRAAERVTGYNYSDFSRIRNAELSRFTIDKLMMVTNALSRRVNVKISVTKQRGADRNPVKPTERTVS